MALPWERTSENGDRHVTSENSDCKLHVERVRKLELFVKTASLAKNKIKPNTRHDQLFHVLRVLRFFVFVIVLRHHPPHVPTHVQKERKIEKYNNHDEEHKAKQKKWGIPKIKKRETKEPKKQRPTMPKQKNLKDKTQFI